MLDLCFFGALFILGQRELNGQALTLALCAWFMVMGPTRTSGSWHLPELFAQGASAYSLSFFTRNTYLLLGFTLAVLVYFDISLLVSSVSCMHYVDLVSCL